MTDISGTPELLEMCWRSLILGLIQGLTEFLPISSTAHLKAVPEILGWGDPGVSTTAVLQLGSILAVLTYFRKELKEAWKQVYESLKRNKLKGPNPNLGIAIIIGTLPIIIAGVSIKLFWPNFENSSLRSIPSIAIVSIFMALLLAWSEKVSAKKKRLYQISIKDGFIIGLSQIFALVPGVSRSGITLSTSLMRGWRREDAARFSFLLSIPAISISGLAELSNALRIEGGIGMNVLPTIIGILSAAIVSWVSIDWLLKYLQRNNMWIFVFYRLIFGLSLLHWWLNLK